MGFLDASDFNALRALAGRWREGWISGRYASQLDMALDAIAARHAEGGDEFAASAVGDSIPGLHDDALLKAAELWGPKADLTVTGTGTVFTHSGSGGRFHARVYVRCLNYAEISS